MSSSKILKKDLGAHVSKTGVNTHEHVDKHEKMQSDKESQIGGTKQTRQT